MSGVSFHIRRFVAQHLFAYLAILGGGVIVVAAVLGREPLLDAWSRFDRRLTIPILALSLVNYVLRFWKWQLQLNAVDARVPIWSSARIYFATFTMVVTPLRVGELYKIIFLRRLHGIPFRRSAPVLIAERLTDGLALIALASLGLFAGADSPLLQGILLLAAVVLGGLLLGRQSVRHVIAQMLRRIPVIKRRATELEDGLESSAKLYSPPVLLPAMFLSLAAWFAECAGTYLVLVGQATPISLMDATWIYAAGTTAGNLTFLPGGLVGTEAAMVAMLHQVGVEGPAAISATVLVRVATLWFAVFLGLVVALLGRRELQWDAVTKEAADYTI